MYTKLNIHLHHAFIPFRYIVFFYINCMMGMGVLHLTMNTAVLATIMEIARVPSMYD